jgi:Zn-dependent peptidase ImmA (M78 family)
VTQVTELCAKAGVAVIFVPEIPGTRTCGATRWLTPTKAMIMLSLRYKTEDHLWFTFFHEAAHILLHGKREVFLEDDDEVSEDVRAKEEEADWFASDFLIPPEAFRRFHPRGAHISHEDIIEFAQQLGIAPGIVVVYNTKKSYLFKILTTLNNDFIGSMRALRNELRIAINDCF